MRYRFASFELDELTRELRDDGRAVPVEPRVFDLIVLLARHRSRVVSREEIHRALWPDSIVGPDSLSRAAKEARRALGDDGARQTFIRTIRGRGYRLIADVQTNSTAGELGEPERLLRDAQLGLEAALDQGKRALQSQIHQFVLSCRAAIATLQDRDP